MYYLRPSEAEVAATTTSMVDASFPAVESRVAELGLMGYIEAGAPLGDVLGAARAALVDVTDSSSFASPKPIISPKVKCD